MSRRVWWLLLVVAVAPYFLNLGATSIIDANEAFYTETPREMLEAGDYLNSTFNYEPRFNKPPLSYWIVLGSYKTFGVSLWSARLPIAVGAIVMIVAAYVLGRMAFSPLAGWVAAISLAATPRFLLFARRIMIDVYSAMFLAVALVAFVLAERQPQRRTRWLLLMYVATGLGLLTKGPVAIVVPALVFPLYLLATGRFGNVRHLMVPTGAVIVLAIAAPYYAALYFQHGWEYITSFLLQENLARYAEGVGAPSRGPLFYVPVVFADFYFPWSLVLPVALAFVPWARLNPWRRPRPSGGTTQAASVEDTRLLLGLWILLIVGFFSFSRGQQDLYVLPFVPAGAALVGGAVAGWLQGDVTSRIGRATRGAWYVMTAILALAGTLAVVVFAWLDQPVSLPGAAAAGLIMVGAAGTSAVLARHRRTGAAVGVALAGVALVSWTIVFVSLPGFERYKPVPRLADTILAEPARAAAVGTYRVAAPSLVYYLRRHVDMMFDPSQLDTFFAGDGPRYCVLRDTDYRAVRDVLSVETRVVAQSPRLDVRVSELLDEGLRELPQLLLITRASSR